MFLVRWRHTIRNCIFRYQSLEISYFWVKIKDSRHFQLAIYTVFHAESEFAVRIEQFLHPEEKIKKNQPSRVSISYRNISYYMSPPYPLGSHRLTWNNADVRADEAFASSCATAGR